MCIDGGFVPPQSPIELLRKAWEDCRENYIESQHEPYRRALEFIETHFVQIEGGYAGLYAFLGAFGIADITGGLGAGWAAYAGAHLGLVTGAVDIGLC